MFYTNELNDSNHEYITLYFQERVTAERLKAYHEKKAKKPALIAKTSVLLDIKPWDDETDMNEMLKSAKSIEKEGLVWGACKLIIMALLMT